MSIDEEAVAARPCMIADVGRLGQVLEEDPAVALARGDDGADEPARQRVGAGDGDRVDLARVGQAGGIAVGVVLLGHLELPGPTSVRVQASPSVLIPETVPERSCRCFQVLRRGPDRPGPRGVFPHRHGSKLPKPDDGPSISTRRGPPRRSLAREFGPGSVPDRDRPPGATRVAA